MKKQTDKVCSVCHGDVTPFVKAGHGYRHIPGLPWCDSKPPVPVNKGE
jgi:hypothetical protein